MKEPEKVPGKKEYPPWLKIAWSAGIPIFLVLFILVIFVGGLLRNC